jgi:hypothetical protein
MKVLMLILISFSAHALAILIEPNQTHRLLCKIQYEILEEASLQSRPITIYGKPTDKGIEFNHTSNDIPAYAFEFDGYGLPEAFWHYDSKVEIKALLKGNNLEYEFNYFNYAGSRKLESVFKEKREILLPNLFYFNESAFNYYDGDLIEGEVNSNIWVNERGIQIQDCRLDIY